MASPNKKTPKKNPDFSYEQSHWNKNYLVIGADEVGRGAFAGPLITAAVILPKNIKIEVEINDSKKLSQKKREIAADWILKNSLTYAYGISDTDYINEYGIMPATHYAFQNALSNLNHNQTNLHLLVDAFEIPNLSFNQTPITKGDSISLSIAAASIIAKVHRDQIMQNLHKDYEIYDWINNNGYGTKPHREAIQKHGICKHHRIEFCKKFTPSFFQVQSDI